MSQRIITEVFKIGCEGVNDKQHAYSRDPEYSACGYAMDVHATEGSREQKRSRNYSCFYNRKRGLVTCPDCIKVIIYYKNMGAPHPVRGGEP